MAPLLSVVQSRKVIPPSERGVHYFYYEYAHWRGGQIALTTSSNDVWLDLNGDGRCQIDESRSMELVEEESGRPSRDSYREAKLYHLALLEGR